MAQHETNAPIKVTYDGTSFIVQNPDTPNKKPINIAEGCLHNDLYRYMSCFTNIFLCWFPGKTECSISENAKKRLDEILFLNQQ